MKKKELIKKYFEVSPYMIDKFTLAHKCKCSVKYTLKVLKELRDEGFIVRIWTAKKYYYRINN